MLLQEGANDKLEIVQEIWLCLKFNEHTCIEKIEKFSDLFLERVLASFKKFHFVNLSIIEKKYSAHLIFLEIIITVNLTKSNLKTHT